jgi:arylsulfatase
MVDSNVYLDWWADHAPYVYLGLAKVTQALASFKEFPVRQKPDSWNLEKIAENMQKITR